MIRNFWPIYISIVVAAIALGGIVWTVTRPDPVDLKVNVAPAGQPTQRRECTLEFTPMPTVTNPGMPRIGNFSQKCRDVAR